MQRPLPLRRARPNGSRSLSRRAYEAAQPTGNVSLIDAQKYDPLRNAYYIQAHGQWFDALDCDDNGRPLPGAVGYD